MAKTFAAQQIRLNAVDLIDQASDPSSGGGVAAVIGSFYARSGTAGIYLKTGAADTAWTRLNASFDWFSVVDYGAVGDGVTDDRAAIAAAITACNAAGGGTVFFPRGTYLCSKDPGGPFSFDLSGTANILFQGTGPDSVLRQNGNAGAAPWSLFRIRSGAIRIAFESVTFDGSGLTNPDPTRTNHLMEVGTGAGGGVTELRVNRCRFQGMVANSGDAIHTLGAAGNLVSRLWVLETMFDGGGNGRYGVNFAEGLEYGWICENYITGFQTEIALTSASATLGINAVVITANELIHTHASDPLSLLLSGNATAAGNTTRLNVSDNIVLGGSAALANTQYVTCLGNVIVGGIYAADTTASWTMQNVVDFSVASNLVVRRSGSGVGQVINIDGAPGAVPQRGRVGNNVLINEVANAGLIRLNDLTEVSVGGNVCRSSNAGASVVAAIDVEATGVDITNLLLNGNTASAAAGSFTAAVRFLCNGANIVNVAATNGVGEQVDYGIRFEIGGGGAFTGRQQIGGNAWTAATGDYQEVGVTLFPNIGFNASTLSAGVRTGNGSPEGVVTDRVGTLFLRRNGGEDTTLYYKEQGTGNTGWVAMGGGPLVFGTGDAGTVATALFMGPGGSIAAANAAELQYTAPRPGTLRNLYVRVTGAGTDAATVTFTVRVNGANTAIVTTASNTATGTFTDLANVATVAAGDLVSVQITKSAGVTAGQTNVFATMELI